MEQRNRRTKATGSSRRIPIALEDIDTPVKKNQRGVSWDKSRGKWRVEFEHNGKKEFLGRYNEYGTAVSVAQSYLMANSKRGVGVRWDNNRNKWHASATYRGKKYHLGRYNDYDEAVKARQMFRDKNPAYE